MLPFLKPKQVAGLILSRRKPDGAVETEKMEGDEDQGLSACSAELIRAIHAKDESAVSSALESAFEILASREPKQDSPEEENPAE